MVVVYGLAVLTVVSSFSEIIAAGRLPKFGCQLDDDYNLLNPLPQTDVNGVPIIQIDPVWSEEDPKTAKFKDEEEFKGFLEALNRANDKVLEENSYDTLTNLFQFFADFENQPKRNLLRFFQSYEERVRPRDGAFFTIELAKRMVVDYPQFADKIHNSYLSTCNLGIFETAFYLRFKRNELNATELPSDLFHDHVMGFMKFQIGEDSNRTGMVVMDPGMGMKDIIVLMDDRTDGLNQFGSKGTGRGISGHLYYYEHVGAYVYAYVDTKAHPLSQLCYTKKGYCSFEATTRKPALTVPSHSLASRDKDGNTLAAVIVNLYHNSDKTTSITLYHKKAFELAKERIQVANTTDLNNYLIRSNYVEMIYNIVSKLGMSAESLMNQMVQMVRTMQEPLIRSKMIVLNNYFLKNPHSSKQLSLE